MLFYMLSAIISSHNIPTQPYPLEFRCIGSVKWVTLKTTANKVEHFVVFHGALDDPCSPVTGSSWIFEVEYEHEWASFCLHK